MERTQNQQLWKQLVLSEMMAFKSAVPDTPATQVISHTNTALQLPPQTPLKLALDNAVAPFPARTSASATSTRGAQLEATPNLALGGNQVSTAEKENEL